MEEGEAGYGREEMKKGVQLAIALTAGLLVLYFGTLLLGLHFLGEVNCTIDVCYQLATIRVYQLHVPQPAELDLPVEWTQDFERKDNRGILSCEQAVFAQEF